jgi:hypothetical protein
MSPAQETVVEVPIKKNAVIIDKMLDEKAITGAIKYMLNNAYNITDKNTVVEVVVPEGMEVHVRVTAK